jgi:nickel-dependent lactate racemase
MFTIKIPYARRQLELQLAESRVIAVLQPQGHRRPQGRAAADLVREALHNPIQAPRLATLARDVRKVLVITSDHTRPVPSRTTLPLLLQELREGNPGVAVKILIATGMHRPTSQEEIREKFGPELPAREEFINHDSRDRQTMVFKGVMPSGGELWLNSLVDWADLIVSEGFIEPHFFAGFSGGRKSILPGIAAEQTVLANHCSRFIADPRARTGILANNPIHRDMLFAAQAAGLRFILNVVIDQDKQIVAAFAGAPEAAHQSGCRFAAKAARVQAAPAEIVVTSNGGYPLDQNIYQSVKGMTAAEACVKPGGVIIMAAACNDGHGGEGFYRWFVNRTPDAVAAAIAGIGQLETLPDQWQAQILARVLQKARVIMVTDDECPPELVTAFHMRHAGSLEQALAMAEQWVGPDAGVTVIPDGVAVIVD